MGLAGSLGGSALGGAMSGTGVHKYDTGLFRAQRSTVRLGIVDRLKALLRANGGYVTSIVSLPKPIRDSEEDLGLLMDALQGQAPAIAVALGKKEYEPSGMDIPADQYTAEIDLHVYGVTASPRNRTDGRLSTDVVGASSAAADPGMEALLEHIEELMIGQPLDIETVLDIRPKHEDELATAADFTAWEQIYTVKVSREVNPDRLVTGLMQSIEAQDNLDGADPANPLVDTVSDLEVP